MKHCTICGGEISPNFRCSCQLLCGSFIIESPSSDEADPKIAALRKVYDEELKEVKQRLAAVELRLHILDGKEQTSAETKPIKIEDLVCPSCKQARWSEIHPSSKDPTGYTLYCRKCEEGCVSPLVLHTE